MNEYIVEMQALVHGSISVEASDETEALLRATEQGMELEDIIEITEATAKSAEYFQRAAS